MKKKTQSTHEMTAAKPNAQKMMAWSTIRWARSIPQILRAPAMRKTQATRRRATRTSGKTEEN